LVFRYFGKKLNNQKGDVTKKDFAGLQIVKDISIMGLSFMTNAALGAPGL